MTNISGRVLKAVCPHRKNVLLAVLAISAELHLLRGGDSNSAALIITIWYGLITAAFGTTALVNTSRESIILPHFFVTINYLLLIISFLPPIFAKPLSMVAKSGHANLDFGYTIDGSSSLIAVIKLIGLGAAYFCGLQLARHPTGRFGILRTANIFLTVIAAWSFLSFCIAPETILGITKRADFFDRLTGPFSSPNSAAALFSCGLLVAYAEILSILGQSNTIITGDSRIEYIAKSLLLPTASVLIFSTDLILSGSRTAIFCCSMVTITYTIVNAKNFRTKPLYAVCAAFWLITFALILTVASRDSSTLNRLTELHKDAHVRYGIYSTHTTVISQRLVTGYGMGSFEQLNHHILSEKNYESLWNVRAMHDVYMQWLEGAGAARYLLMFSVICSTFYLCVKEAANRKDNTIPSAPTIVGLITLMLFFDSIFDFPLENYSISTWLALILGVGSASLNRGRRAGYNRHSLQV